MKKIVYRIIEFLFDSVLRMYRKFINAKLTIVDDISSTYTSLMPREDIDISNYENAINFALTSRQKIRNIALMGTYGSGKSSIMNSYAKKHLEHKYIHISLAHFSDNIKILNRQIEELKEKLKEQKGKTFDEKTVVDEKEIANFLECKILNQLIHQIKASNISESNFSIKQPVPKRKKVIYMLGAFILSVAILYFVFYSTWFNLITPTEYKILKMTLGTPFKLFLIFASLAEVFFIIKSFFMKGGYLNKFRKIGIKNIVDIEVFDETSDSAFDKHLDEVIYLFENCDADVIIFEDLDRYDSTLIFEKLREINYLINEKNKDSIIKFVYLIKDDIFTCVERNKFFDFIIPVIPVVDVSNSSDKFLNLLEKAQCSDGIDKQFLKDLSFYLNDMRLLCNIVNEYQVYKNTMEKINGCENANYQLALVIYKNLFPEDFHALQSGSGYVYNVFKYKEAVYEDMLKQLQNQKDNILKRISEFEEQTIKNIDELNAIYFPLNEMVYMINNNVVGADISRVDLIKEILENKDSVQVYRHNSYVKLDVTKCIEKMENDVEYVSRRKILELSENDEKVAIEKEMSDITHKINLLPTKRLKELLVANDIEEFWNSVNEKYVEEGNYINSVISDRNFPLIKYLISNGYINEDYSIYSSYIYSQDITPNDRNFIISVYDRKKLSYEYRLDCPEKVIENINQNVFMLPNIDNNNLLMHLIESKNHKLLNIWFNAIEEREKDGYNFVIEFWKLHKNNADLLNCLTQLKPGWIKVWYMHEMFSDTDLRDFVLGVANFCEIGTFEKINLDNWLTQKISNMPDFLDVNPNNTKKYCAELKNINVIFTNVKSNIRNKQIFEFIYQNNMYEINENNVREVVNEFTRFDIKTKAHGFCGYVYDSSDKPIARYLLSNINEFINVGLKLTNRKFSDKQKVILSIINDSALSMDNKLKYMKRSSNKIKKIENIHDTAILTELLMLESFDNTWHNMAIYYIKVEGENDGISEELANAMTNATEESALKYANLNKLLSPNDANKLRKNLIRCIYFDKATYERILGNMTVTYPEFGILELPQWQLEICIKLDIIAKNPKNYTFVKENYNKNINDFMFLGGTSKLFNQIKDKTLMLEKVEILDFLSDARITEEQSMILLGQYEGVVSIENKNYSDEVCSEIINKHFNVEDLPWLLKNYGSLGYKTKKALLNYTLQNHARILTIVDTINILPSDIYAILIHKQFCDDAKLTKYRSVLSDTRYEAACLENKSPSFPDTEYNRIILDYFKEQGWISSYKDSKGKLRCYPKRKAS